MPKDREVLKETEVRLGDREVQAAPPTTAGATSPPVAGPVAAPITGGATSPPIARPEGLREQRDGRPHPNVVTTLLSQDDDEVRLPRIPAQCLKQRKGYPKPALPPPLPTERLALPYVPFIYLQRSISAHAPLFAKEYKNSVTSEAKEETRWMILCKAQMYAHKASPIPGVEEALKAIDASLECAPDAVDAGL